MTLELKPEQAETLARSRQAGTLALALRSITDGNMVETGSEEQAQKRGSSINVVRYGMRARRRHRSDRKDADYEVWGKSVGDAKRLRSRALLFSAVAALTLSPLPTCRGGRDRQGSVPGSCPGDTGNDPVTTSAIGGSARTRFLSLGVGKSVVVDLPRDVKDVLVADPKIANAVIRSAQRAYIIGAAVGQTNVVFFDADGQQVGSYDIAVKRDLNGVRAALRQRCRASRSKASATA